MQVGLIESGSECRRLFPVLSMIADNEAAADARVDADAHLENCLACQATLREMRSAPKDLAAVLPVGIAVGAGHGFAARIIDPIQGAVQSIYERLFGHAAAASQGAEVITAKKIAGVTAIVAALAGGGVAAEHAINHGESQAAPNVSAGGTRAVGPLYNTVPLDVRRSARRRSQARRAAAAERASEAETARTVQSSPDLQDAEPLTDDAGGGAAGDPADIAPGVGSTTDRCTEGLAP